MLNAAAERKLFGRDSELEQLNNYVNSNHHSVTYIVGEHGIGKSAFLEEFYKKIAKENTKFLIGFCDRNDMMIGESSSPIYPFVTALEDLVEWTKVTQTHVDIMKGIMYRLENAFVEFAKQQGSEMVGAILRDVAKKVGLVETLKVAEGLIKNYKKENSAQTLALLYAQQQNNEPIISYVGVIRSLLEEFKDRTLVFIFDHVCMRRKSLDVDDEIRLNKIAILAQLPLMTKQIPSDIMFDEIAGYLGLEPERYPRFIERLVEKGLFELTDEGYGWFRHELVHICLQERLKKQYNPLYRKYNENAARFYEALINKMSKR
jgi:AAA+ ATPase superfamily predicted ATPase